MADKLSYENKEGIVPKETHINQIWDDDMNEIKLKFNNNADLIDSNTAKGAANETAIGNIQQPPYTTLKFNATPAPPYEAGVMWYDGVNWNKYDNIPGTSLQDGKEIVLDVMNDNGNPLANFTAVQWDSQSGIYPTVKRAQADTVSNASGIGLCTHDLAVGDVGKLIMFGTAGGDTSAWNAGDNLFLSATVAGELTNVEQPILNRIARVLVSDAVDGLLLVSPTGVLDITAVGQAFGAGQTQDITTTPTPLSGFNTGDNFTLNTTATEIGARVQLSPASVGASGHYRVVFNVSLSSSNSDLLSFEIYINGTATGVKCLVDLRNNNIDAGNGSINSVTTSVLDNNDIVEIYCYNDGGTTSTTLDSVSLNIERIGNV